MSNYKLHDIVRRLKEEATNQNIDIASLDAAYLDKVASFASTSNFKSAQGLNNFIRNVLRQAPLKTLVVTDGL